MSTSIAPSSFNRSGFTAFTLPDGSKAGLCAEDSLTCVHGHNLKTNAVTLVDTVVRCAFRDPRPGVTQCNAPLFVALLHAGGSAVVKGEGERFYIVIELNDDKIRYLIRTPMTMMEKLRYLGATLPGVEPAVR